MNIFLYGGSFNPPHLGHREVVSALCSVLHPERFLIIPDRIPPHKDMAADSPLPEDRLRLCKLAFGDIPGVEISDIELKREGKSYTYDTVSALRQKYPQDHFTLVMGTDMFLSFEEWYRFRDLLGLVELLVLAREADDEEVIEKHAASLRHRFEASITVFPHEPISMCSADIRIMLPYRRGREFLHDSVYSEIIRCGYYRARPELCWLRGKAYPYLAARRIPHVAGCESEAIRLAERWGADRDDAAEAAILHDMTKKLSHEEQLKLCEKYDIICDTAERDTPKLLHAKTGAVLASVLFGVPDRIRDAIRWHTTGRPDMTMLEKIIYLADYIEPNRDFPGVGRLRTLCYSDLDKAMQLGLSMSLDEIRERGKEPYIDTVLACAWYKEIQTERKEEHA